MYKSYLKKWGLRKYVPRNQHPRPASKPKGIAVGSAANATQAAQSTPVSGVESSIRASQPPNSIAPQLDAPNCFRIPEECMYLFLMHLRNGRPNCHHDLSATARSITKSELWMNKVLLGSQLLCARQYAQGFTVINLCFDQYKDFMLQQEPWLVFSTYIALYDLARTEHRLGHLFIRFASQLVRLAISAPHPLLRLFTLIEKAGAVNTRDHAIRVLECFLETLAPYLPRNQLFTMRSILKIHERFPISPTLSLSMSDRTVADVIKQLRQEPHGAVLADLRNTKTGLKEAFVCQRQRDANASLATKGVIVSDQIATEQADIMGATMRHAQIQDHMASEMANYTSVELRSDNYSATAIWTDLDACIRNTGDARALGQITALYPVIKAQMLTIFTAVG